MHRIAVVVYVAALLLGVTSALELNLPKPLNVCNVSDLTFNRSRMHLAAGLKGGGGLFYPIIPDHSLGIAYGPRITKCGSTAAINMITRITNMTNGGSISLQDASNLQDYTFVTF